MTALYAITLARPVLGGVGKTKPQLIPKGSA
jgi:hypothetical protein